MNQAVEREKVTITIIYDEPGCGERESNNRNHIR